MSEPHQIQFAYFVIALGIVQVLILGRVLTHLRTINRKINMATQAEIAAGLKQIQTQIGKVAKEQSDRFDALTAKIKELTDLINAGGDATPEVTSALADVQTALQALDDTIPDAPTPPPTP